MASNRKNLFRTPDNGGRPAGFRPRAQGSGQHAFTRHLSGLLILACTFLSSAVEAENIRLAPSTSIGRLGALEFSVDDPEKSSLDFSRFDLDIPIDTAPLTAASWFTSYEGIAGDFFINVEIPTVDLAAREAFIGENTTLTLTTELIAVGGDCTPTVNPPVPPPDCVHAVKSSAFSTESLVTTGSVFILESIPTGANAQNEIEAFIARHAVLGRQFKFRWLVDPRGTLPESPDALADNALESPHITLYPLNGEVNFGRTQTLASVAVSGLPLISRSPPGTSPCAESELLHERGQLKLSDPTWSLDVDLAPARGGLCSTLVAGDAGFSLQVQQGRASSAGTEIDNGFIQWRASINVRPTGLEFRTSSLQFSSAVSIHRGINRPRSAGAGRLSFTPSLLSLSDSLDSPIEFDLADQHLWLHSEGVPFSGKISTLQISKTAPYVRGVFSDLHYVHAVEFDPTDPRATSGVTSNDFRFAAPTSTMQRFELDASGRINFSATFAGSEGQLHYPRARMKHSGFDVTIAGGALIDEPLDTDTSGAPAGDLIEFTQRAECGICITDTASGPRFREFATSAMQQSSDGGIMFTTLGPSDAPGFGERDPTTGARTFQRTENDAEVGGVFYAPGFWFPPASEDEPAAVVDSLLGSRPYTASNGSLFPRQSNAARKGNYFFAGINRGPEIFSDPDGGRVLAGAGNLLTAGQGTTVYLGGITGNPPVFLSSAPATKYVVRTGGLTGAFNHGAPTNTDFDIYGFPASVDTFDFRVRNNLIETSGNGIQGVLSVPGRAGLRIPFRDLDVDCLGRVDRVSVTFELCDRLDNNGNGVVDEGCDQTLSAWAAPYKPILGEFVSAQPSDEICSAAPRNLRTFGIASWLALKRPFVLRAEWDNQGEVIGMVETVGGSPNRLDTPASPATPGDDLGFWLNLRGTARLATAQDQPSDGWLDLDALLVPGFWENLPASIRVSNQSAQTPAPSLVAKPGTFASQWADGTLPERLTNAEVAPRLITAPEGELDLRYQWTSDVGFGLPVFYQPARAEDGKRPQLLGRRGTPVDLPAVRIDSKVLYAEPDGNTALDFGLSTDPNVIGEAATGLHVDFDDPESLAELDAFLAEQFGLTGDPMQTYLRQAQDAFAAYNDLTDDGLEGLLRSQLAAEFPDEASRQLLFAGAFYRAQQFESFSTMVDGIIAEFDKKYPINVSGFERNLSVDQILPVLDALFKNYYNNAPSRIVAAANDPTALPADLADAQLEMANRFGGMAKSLGVAINQMDAIFGDSRSRIEEALVKLETERNALQPQIDAVIGELNQVEAIFAQTAINQCTPLTRTVSEIEADVRYILNSYSLTSIVDVSRVLAPALGFDPGPINDIQRELRRDQEEIGADLLGLLEDARARVACVLGEPPPNDPDAINIAEVEAAMVDVVAEIRAEITRLVDVTDLFIRLLTGPNGAVTEIIDALEQGQRGLSAKSAILKRMTTASRRITSAAQNGTLPIDLTGAFGTTDSVASIQAQWDASVRAATNGQYGWVNQGGVYETMGPLVIAQSIEIVEGSIQLIAEVADRVFAPYVSALTTLTTQEEWEAWVIDIIIETRAVQKFLRRFEQDFVELDDRIEALVLDTLDGSALVIQKALDSLASGYDRFAGLSTGNVKGLRSLRFNGLDGYAQISQGDISRIRLNGDWSQGGTGRFAAVRLTATLDLQQRERFNEASGCDPYAGDAHYTASLLKTNLSTYGINLIGTEGYLLNFDFRMDFGPDQDVLGMNGRARVEKLPLFGLMNLHGVDFAGATGGTESWFAAETNASLWGFENTPSVNVALILGDSCSADPIRAYDPNFSEFVDLPGGFDGWFVRGGLSTNIVNLGCVKRAGVSGDVGAYSFRGSPAIKGALIGGGVHGKAACIGGIRGQANLTGQVRGGSFEVSGDLFGVAGSGLDCDPHTWTSVPRSRRDGWCGTGDLRLDAQYQRGKLSVGRPRAGAVY